MWDNLSTTLKNCIFKGILPKLQIQLTLYRKNDDGSVTPRYLMSGTSFNLGEGATKRLSCVGDYGGPVGACNIGSFEFSIFNDTKWKNASKNTTFTDASIKVWLRYNWTDEEGAAHEMPLQFGKYTVVSHEFTDSGRMIVVHGYDDFYKLDLEEFDFNTAYAGKSEVYGKEMLLDVLDGFTISSSSYDDCQWLSEQPPNKSDYLIWKSTYLRHGKNMPWPDIPKMTKRQALTYLLQLKGEYAFINGRGEVVIRPASYGTGEGRYTTLQQSFGAETSETSYPYFTTDVSPSLLSGFEFSNPLLEDEKEMYGDRSAVYASFSNPFFLESSWSGNVYNAYRLDRFLDRRSYMGGSLTLLSAPFEPGDIVKNDPWGDSMGRAGGAGFMATTITWRDKSTTISLNCDMTQGEYADLRKDPESYEPTPDIFETGGGTTLVPDGEGGYYVGIPTTAVPTRYLNSYICIATPTSGATITKVETKPYACYVHTDTSGATISYQLCKPTATNSNTNSVTTNYGALAQNYLQNTEESYKS